MKNYYETIEEAYRDLVGPLSRYASSHLHKPDECIDAVHDAFTKTVEYARKHTDRRISKYVLYRETIRACRRRNKKTSLEVPHDFNSQEANSGLI
jgi:hypothetical protein